MIMTVEVIPTFPLELVQTSAVASFSLTPPFLHPKKVRNSRGAISNVYFQGQQLNTLYVVTLTDVRFQKSCFV